MGKKLIFKVSDFIEESMDWEKEQSEKLGLEFEAYQMKYASPEELVKTLKDADILVVNMSKMTPEVMSNLDNVKVILRHGIGYDNLDLPSATEAGIVCANQPTASSEDVAEQAIMLICATYRRFVVQQKILDVSVKNARWIFDTIKPVYRLAGKTLGILGCGKIGSFVLNKMRSFGMNIIVCDPYLSEERKNELGITHTPFEEFLTKSDIVTIHVPVTDETRKMLNRDTIKLMKPSAILVNTARGPIVNADHLAEALKKKEIAGVGIDVYDIEPPTADYPLFGMDDALLTPHLAWYSEEGGWDIRETILTDVKRFIDGKLPVSVINPEVLTHPNLKMKFSE